MEHRELIPHLFRSEFSRITAVIGQTFGFQHLETAEDIASETFLAAMETWPHKGIPPQPVAWLYHVAKNKAINYQQRGQLYNSKIKPYLENEKKDEEITIDLSEHNINDSQLKMMFAVCHPSIPPASQIALALRILCGFGIPEIAGALLSTPEAISKRLQRAKETLRNENVQIALPGDAEMLQRLDTVLTTLYLLFNEGYYSESNNQVLRKDLCYEAMRLVKMLWDNETTSRPAVGALLALMCFHASRFDARTGLNGEMILYHDQDATLWNQSLVLEGINHLQQSSSGNVLSSYHLEASIAYWYTVREDSEEKWQQVLQLYNHLLAHSYSPIAALNRTYALAKVKGAQAAIIEAEKLKLTSNPYYFTLLGVLYMDVDRYKAREHFEKALSLAQTNADKAQLNKWIKAL